MAGRWVLGRAGIVNVYQYGEEVLRFGGGRLLLRGVNGSGKSTAMNMLLPFLLDADVRRIDAAGEPVSGATAADFRITENGIQRPITLLDCPPAGALVPISSVLVVDISRSMSFTGNNNFTGLAIAQTAALAWIELNEKN